MVLLCFTDGPNEVHLVFVPVDDGEQRIFEEAGRNLAPLRGKTVDDVVGRAKAIATGLYKIPEENIRIHTEDRLP